MSVTEADAPEGVIEKKPKTEISRPRMYMVVALNDDFTPFEVVYEILEKIFHKTTTEAVKIAETIHFFEKADIAAYTLEIAETKVTEAIRIARSYGAPFQMEIREIKS